jgi:hypothetical protein
MRSALSLPRRQFPKKNLKVFDPREFLTRRSAPSPGTTSAWRNIDFDKDFLLELEPCSTHYEMYEG